MVTGGSFAGVKRPGREADHSPQSSAEIKECVLMAWYLVKHRDNFTFTLPFYFKILDDRDSFSGGGNDRIFLFVTASKTALGPTQPPTQWVPGALTQGVKRLGREAVHLPPFGANVKNAWSYTSTSPVRLHGVGVR
jgi:hypothetical protein